MDQEQIGKFIAKCRKNKNMTQEELAEKLNVNVKSISRWENGKTMPDISMLGELSETLNTSIQELLNGRNMTKEELLELKGTLEKLIEYENSKENTINKKATAIIMIANCLLLISICDGQLNFLQYVFTAPAQDFFNGLLSGSSLVLNIIGITCLQKKKIKNK